MDRKEHSRRLKLQRFTQFALSHFSNRCDSLARIIDEAIRLASADGRLRAETVLEDLKCVIIGNGLLAKEGRGHGRYYAGYYPGAAGFREELRDRWYQVQHATAGLYAGFHYPHPIFERIAVFLERNEPQDQKLYRATIPLGRELRDSNLMGLSERLRNAIGDHSCLSYRLENQCY